MNTFSIRRFVSMLLQAAPRAMLASLVLMGLVALTEGAGLLLCCRCSRWRASPPVRRR